MEDNLSIKYIKINGNWCKIAAGCMKPIRRRVEALGDVGRVLRRDSAFAACKMPYRNRKRVKPWDMHSARLLSRNNDCCPCHVLAKSGPSIANCTLMLPKKKLTEGKAGLQSFAGVGGKSSPQLERFADLPEGKFPIGNSRLSRLWKKRMHGIRLNVAAINALSQFLKSSHMQAVLRSPRSLVAQGLKRQPSLSKSKLWQTLRMQKFIATEIQSKKRASKASVGKSIEGYQLEAAS